jgi:hypothetical protein
VRNPGTGIGHEDLDDAVGRDRPDSHLTPVRRPVRDRGDAVQSRFRRTCCR